MMGGESPALALENVSLFPFAEYWTFYVGFVSFVLILLLLDLGLFHRKAHSVSMKEAGAWSVIWISLALVFAFLFWHYALYRFGVSERLNAIAGFDPTASANRVALEFLTGFVVEKALAVDNLFVFIVIFQFFNIPPQYQHRILFYGILGALVFRAGFIAIGAALMQIHWAVVLFGVFLVFTGVKVMLAGDKPLDPEKNRLLRLLRRHLPVTNDMSGGRFFLKLGGKWFATPLFVCLIFIEFSDIVFAVDSVPAIFAITREPLIVFTSNIFAILGLRSLFFLLAAVVHLFHYLKYGLGLVLIFVGLKMVILNELFGGKFPIGWSLGLIAGILGGSILLSWLFPPAPEKGQ
jgi:tellurite resistance protein TerC